MNGKTRLGFPEEVLGDLRTETWAGVNQVRKGWNSVYVQKANVYFFPSIDSTLILCNQIK